MSMDEKKYIVAVEAQGAQDAFGLFSKNELQTNMGKFCDARKDEPNLQFQAFEVDPKQQKMIKPVTDMNSCKLKF